MRVVRLASVHGAPAPLVQVYHVPPACRSPCSAGRRLCCDGGALDGRQCRREQGTGKVIFTVEPGPELAAPHPLARSGGRLRGLGLRPRRELRGAPAPAPRVGRLLRRAVDAGRHVGAEVRDAGHGGATEPRQAQGVDAVGVRHPLRLVCVPVMASVGFRSCRTQGDPLFSWGLGRSQGVRHRFLVPGSQVQILPPQPTQNPALAAGFRAGSG